VLIGKGAQLQRGLAIPSKSGASKKPGQFSHVLQQHHVRGGDLCKFLIRPLTSTPSRG